MYTLEVENRDAEIRVKKLRKSGLVPCSLSDGKAKETILLAAAEGEAKKLLRAKGKGGRVMLSGKDGKTYETIIKEFSFVPMNNQIEHITFQLLHENEPVNSCARVIVCNRDKIQGNVSIPVREIPYRALPQDLVEEIEIDLTTVRKGSSLLLKELSLWENQKLELALGADTAIVHVS